MIRRIATINDRGVFQRWRWPRENPGFETTTVIYGANGSGKSTLSSLLADAAAGAADLSGLVIETAQPPQKSGQRVTSDETQRVLATDTANPLWGRIHVFDRRYVDENLSFDQDPSAEHLLTLGKQAVEDLALIQRHQERITEIHAERAEAKKRADRARHDHGSLATTTAKRIVEQCEGADPRFSGRTYNAPKVRALLSGDRNSLAVGQSSDEQGDLDVIRERTLTAIGTPTWPADRLPTLEARATELLGRSVTSSALESLPNDREISDWVKNGVRLHHDRATCLFCEGEVRDERRQALERHFDRAYLDLQSALQTLDHELGEFLEMLREAINALPRTTDFASELQAAFEEWRTATVARRDQLEQRVSVIRVGIKNKLERIFAATPMPDLPDAPAIDADELLSLVRKHNDHCKNLDDRRAAAATRIEHLRVAKIADDYDGYVDEAETAAAKVDELVTEDEQLSTEIENLQRQDVDPGPLARELTVDLERLLGRRELAFTASAERDRYTITRGGEPALRLSEGERTAISLLYFLASLRQDASGRPAGEKQIVVVDDPVSSLDSSVMLGASSHLWLRLHKEESVSQVIVLTHSFELLRTWMNLLDEKGCIAELRMTTAPGVDGPVRTPRLIQWSRDRFERKRLRSEYHYLFWRVASTLVECGREEHSLEAEMDAVAILPNAARKMLEGFLSFKRPQQTGSLSKAIEHYADHQGAAHGDAILRFLHQQSHNEQLSLQAGVNTTTAIETLTAVFEFMRTVDEEHFDSMWQTFELPLASDGKTPIFVIRSGYETVASPALTAPV